MGICSSTNKEGKEGKANNGISGEGNVKAEISKSEKKEDIKVQGENSKLK